MQFSIKNDDDDSDDWYSAPKEQEELVVHYPTSLSPQTVPGPHTHTLSSPSPPARPGDLTSTDESGSLCHTVESPVSLESQGGGTLWCTLINLFALYYLFIDVFPYSYLDNVVIAIAI